jgi:AcrR family transcriptional regulator
MPAGSAAQTARRPAARRGRKPRFSSQEIARVALELIDTDGLDSFSMQRLAEALGMGTMTLYGYFRNKDELLEAVVDTAVKGATAPRLAGPWPEQMRALVNAAYRGLRRHPALVEIRFRQPILRPHALRFGENVMRILVQAGFAPDEAASGFRLIFTYTFGFAGLSPERDLTTSRHQAAAAAARLPSEEFPNLTATAAQWTKAIAGSEQFEYGLDRILDGLKARLERLANEEEHATK